MPEPAGNPCILVVEDDALQRELIRPVLAAQGFVVLEAETGEAGLQLLDEHAVDLLLLDVILPGCDGFEVCRTIRARNGGDRLPILVLTARGEEAAIDQAFASGATGFINKPISQNHLVHRIRYTLKAQSAINQLETRRHQLERAQKLARLGFWEWDPEQDRLLWSEEARRILELPPLASPDFTESYLSRVPRQEQEEVQAAFERARHVGEGFNIVHHVQRSDARPGLVHLHGEVQRDASGRPGLIHGTLMDLSEQHHLQKALQQERDFVAAIFNTSGALVMVLDPKGRIVRFNRACELVSGYSAAEVEQLSAWELLFPAETADSVRNAWQSAIGRGKPFRTQDSWLTKQGRKRLISWSNTLLPDEQGDFCFLLATGIDVTDRKQAEDRIVQLGYYDTLTELPNRHLFRDRLEQALLRARRSGRLVAILFIDLDRFKRINETLGYSEGDRMLREVSRRFREDVRLSDTVARVAGEDEELHALARLGGDEFCVLLADLQRLEDAARGAKRLHQVLQAPFLLGGGQEIFVTASIGISLFPHDGTAVETLIRNAEIAMYHAKREGPENVQFYSQSLNSMAFERLLLESDLARAVERGELSLFYQPIVAAGSGRIAGMEALARWKHPEHGLITPNHFIPMAIETGAIRSLVEWTLDEAARQLQAWRNQGLAPVEISINMPSRHFVQEDLQGMIERVVDSYGLDPRLLKLEITEEAIMRHEEASIATLGALRELGVGVALDDFGTGYSSLSFLKNFPVDSLKIAQPFIHELPDAPRDVAIVQAIIAMAHTLGLRVVAEGVESRAQLEFLRGAGCDFVQGFYVGMPLPPDALTDLLQAGSVPI